jgi:NAD+ synthase
MFNAKKVKDQLVEWIRNWFEQNGKGCNAVIGISGGKDSTVVAALCAEALGKDRVYGILMPNGVQHDIDVSRAVVKHLGIHSIEVDISAAVCNVLNSIRFGLHDNCRFAGGDEFPISDQTKVNLPPRIRMATLYAVSQSINGRVSNNCNLSEDWVGYSTRWGDSVGDFAPLANLTVTEVKAVGRELGLPAEFIDKVPSDGLCGKTDEDNLGFTYDALDRYIRTGVCEDAAVKLRIDTLHKKNLFKLQPMPSFPYKPTGRGAV